LRIFNPNEKLEICPVKGLETGIKLFPTVKAPKVAVNLIEVFVSTVNPK
jgi:hypothetical protein